MFPVVETTGMQQRRVRTAGSSAADDRGSADVHTRTEQLHLRNYDTGRRYRVTLSVSNPDGPPEHEATYELAPGEVASELEVVPPGRYDVHVDSEFRPANGRAADGTAGSDSTTTVCNVGDRAGRTVVVECGNGIVDVSEGLVD